MDEQDIFEVKDFSEVKSRDFELIVTEDRKRSIFGKLGYEFLDGILVDKQTGEEVKIEERKNIHIKDKKIALLSGSHIFVKGIAGYSQVIAERKDIEFKIEKKWGDKDEEC